jgi:SAM-dependent methyltransferase
MAAWSDGYFTDVQYTGHYYPHMAPGALTFAALRRGVRPAPLRPGATYLELGCGQGFGLNLLAAANPHLNFLGIDFHPGQIANARRLAAEAGLKNVVFEDFSFEQALALPVGRLPRCAIAAAHGVISWISPENRARVVALLDRLLEPGGLAMVSYNTYPGWAAILPLQRFVKGFVDRSGDPPAKAVVAALETAETMAETGEGVFARAPQLKAAIRSMRRAEPAYVLHELAHDHFHPMFHADVVRELEAARLSFVGSVQLSDDMPSLAVPAKLLGAVGQAGDPVWQETLIDYATDRWFRRDLYVRGANRLTGPERAAALGALQFTLARPRARVDFNFKVPVGTLNGAASTYEPLLDALDGEPRPFEALLRLPGVDGDEPLLIKALGLLVENGAAHPAVDGDVDAAPARAFNRVLVDRYVRDQAPGRFAAPRIGAGVPVNFAEFAALAASPDRKGDPQAAAELGLGVLRRTGVRLQKAGQPIVEDAEAKAELAARIEAFEAGPRALLSRLGAV